MRPRFFRLSCFSAHCADAVALRLQVSQRPQIRDGIKDSQEVVIITTTGERRITTTLMGLCVRILSRCSYGGWSGVQSRR